MVRSVYKPQLILIVLISLLLTFFPLILLHIPMGGMKNIWILFFFPVLGIFLFYTTFQKGPRVILDENFITIKKLTGTDTFDWSNVQEVSLNKKESYNGHSMEATVIIFNNSDKLILWDNMYSNGAEMRNFINSKAGPKERDPPPKITEKSIFSVNRRIYAGNVFTSVNTLLIAGLAIFLFFTTKSGAHRNSVILMNLGIIAILLRIRNANELFFN